MKEFQELGQEELVGALKKRNYWERIHANALLSRKRHEVPAKILKDGLSQTITYYNERSEYLCTMHRVVSKDGDIVHEDVKDAFLDGVWYKSIKKLS